MFNFYLIRHGETESNSKGIVTGQADSKLSKEGKINALSLANNLQNISFDAIYSSDLGRTLETANIILKSLGLKLKINTSEELRETNYGIYNNRKRKDVEKECPEYRKNIFFTFPNGENLFIMQKRVINFISNLEKKHNNQTLLIITHGGPIRAIISHYNNLNFGDFLNEKLTHKYIGKFKINNSILLSYDIISE